MIIAPPHPPSPPPCPAGCPPPPSGAQAAFGGLSRGPAPTTPAFDGEAGRLSAPEALPALPGQQLEVATREHEARAARAAAREQLCAVKIVGLR